MIFEDIAHKYKIGPLTGGRSQVNVWLVKKIPSEVVDLIEMGAREVLIGYFRDETIARNVALSLEFYKEKNKMIDGVLQDDKSS